MATKKKPKRSKKLQGASKRKKKLVVKPKDKKKKPKAKPVKHSSKKPVKKAAKKPAKKPKKRKKLVTRPAFEGRRKQPEFTPPEGFDIKPTATTVEEAYATMEARLIDAQSQLPEGYTGKVLMHVYKDGSVDGELYVKVPEGVSTGDVELSLFDSFESITVGQRYWISSGARYQLKTDDERYRRFKGMTQVQTNYQRALQTNIAESYLIVRDKLIAGMDRKFGQEAHSVFIRLHWNPENIQPKR